MCTGQRKQYFHKCACLEAAAACSLWPNFSPVTTVEGNTDNTKISQSSETVTLFHTQTAVLMNVCRLQSQFQDEIKIIKVSLRSLRSGSNHL